MCLRAYNIFLIETFSTCYNIDVSKYSVDLSDDRTQKMCYLREQNNMPVTKTKLLVALIGLKGQTL